MIETIVIGLMGNNRSNEQVYSIPTSFAKHLIPVQNCPLTANTSKRLSLKKNRHALEKLRKIPSTDEAETFR